MILKLIVFVVAVARVPVYFKKKKEKIVGMYSLVSLVSQIWIQTVVLL